MLLVAILNSMPIHTIVSADLLIIVIFVCPIVFIGITIFLKTNILCVTNLTTKVTRSRSKTRIAINTNITKNTANIGNQCITNQLMFLLYHQRKNLGRNKFHQKNVRLDV